MANENQFPEYDKYLDGDEEIVVKRSQLNRDIDRKSVANDAPDAFEDIYSNYEPVERAKTVGFVKKTEVSQATKAPETPKPQKPMEDISSKSKKAPNKQKIGLGILCGVTGVLEVIAVIMLAMIGVLPTSLLALVGVAFALLLFIICTLMFMKSKHKFGKRKIVATILAAITIISCLVGIFFMSRILGVFGAITKDSKKITKEELDDPFVMYISGSDTRNIELDKNSRSDVNILAIVNPVTYQVLLVNTPRDYYVQNPNCNNKMDKLTHCGLGGIESSMQALEQLYGLDEIDYYCRINFTGFETLIDAIDGIDVYSNIAFTAYATTGSSFSAGWNHLNGTEALAFARERHALASGDFARGEHQMEVIKAVVNKMTSSDTLVRNFGDIMNSMKGMFETNTPQLLIQDIIKNQLSESPKWNIKSFAVTGSLGTEICASSGEALSVVYQDEDMLNQAKEHINQVMNGEILAVE